MSILSQVISEHNLGEQYFLYKKQQYRDRIRKYNNQSKNKVNITLIANHIDTMIASSYTDMPTVKFVSRDGFFGKERAEQLTYTARFDQQDQDYWQLYYQKEQDRLFFGVSLRLITWRDDQKKSPTFVSINPLSWITDPNPTQTASYWADKYRFHWLTMKTNIMELKKSWQYSNDVLNKIIKDYYDSQEEQNDQAYNDAWNYPDHNTDTLTENFSVNIYHHFTIYNWKKHLVTTTWDRTLLLRDLELKAVLKEEKENPLLIPRPLVMNYWRPQRNNPFGESVCDYLETKQDAINILANLNIVKAKKSALGWRFLLNSRLIKNKEDILNPSIDTQYIRLNDKAMAGWENIQNAAYEIPQSTIKNDTFTMTQYLEAESQKTTWIDALQSWITPDKTMTKAEAQQIQANANLKMIKDAKINWWWDKDFWFLRWRAYQEFFSKTDKKFITLDIDFEDNITIFEKDSFSYKEMPYIKTWLKSDLDAIDEKRKQFLSLYLPQAKQDPDKSPLVKNELEREYLRLNWYSKNQVNTMIPLTKDERIMLNDYIPMLNSNIVPEWMFERVKDLFTAYIYIQKAQDTEAKTTMLATLQAVMTQDDEAWSQQQWWWQMSNSAANIQMSQASQQTQWADVLSRASNLPQ